MKIIFKKSFNLLGFSLFFQLGKGKPESFKACTQESPIADKFNAIVKSPVDKALDEILPPHLQVPMMNGQPVYIP